MSSSITLQFALSPWIIPKSKISVSSIYLTKNLIDHMQRYFIEPNMRNLTASLNKTITSEVDTRI